VTLQRSLRLCCAASPECLTAVKLIRADSCRVLPGPFLSAAWLPTPVYPTRRRLRRGSMAGRASSRPALNAESEKIRAYDGLARGELEHAMSASSSPPPPHRIGIIMSPVGRFLQCRDCQLSYTFPDGVKFGTVAKQFESHLCLPPNLQPRRANGKSPPRHRPLRGRSSGDGVLHEVSAQVFHSNRACQRTCWGGLGRKLMGMSVKSRRDKKTKSTVPDRSVA